MVRFVKRKEQQTASALGYDPFKPLMSSNMPGAAVSTCGDIESGSSGKRTIVNGVIQPASIQSREASPRAPSDHPDSRDIENFVDVDEVAALVNTAFPEAVAKVNDALEMLLTSSGRYSDQNASLTLTSPAL